MVRPASRSGFTLVEVLVTSSLSLVVLGAVMTTFLVCQRMFRATMAEAELTLAIRDLRDRLLFRAGPGLNEGLLTGTARADSSALTMTWPTDASDTSETGHGPDKIRILIKNDEKGNYFFNERVSHTDANENWFRPSGLRLQQNWSATVDLPRIRIDLGSTLYPNVREQAWILLPH